MRANEHTAAVAASNSDSAAAVAFSPQDLENTHVTQLFRTNNAALKFFRDSNESRYGIPTIGSIELTPHVPITIAVIQHEPKGKRY